MKLPLYLCLLALWSGFGRPLVAKDFAAYRIGDVADMDVVTPVALDVVDAAATAELKSAKAREFPAIFRNFSGATNLMTYEFLATFERGHRQFLAEMTNEFHAETLDEAIINSADFGRLVTAFGVEDPDFPVSDELAAEWARGKDGRAVRTKLLAELQWAAGRYVRPDALPAGMTVGGMVRLVPVTDPDQKLSFEALQAGQLVAAANLMTASNAQALFRREFPAQQQIFARALAVFIRPNCLPDAPLTTLTRGTAVYQLVVSDHLDAGDTIVRQGDAIDAKAQAALFALAEALKKEVPAVPSVAVVAAPPAVTPPAVPPRPSPATETVRATAPAPAASGGILVKETAPAEVPAGRRHYALGLSLAGVFVGALLVTGGVVWRLRKRKQTLAVAAPLAGNAQANLVSQVSQVVREAVQQELAAQRRDLLLTQQAATEEISALVRRLDAVQMPMQQRLQTYEERIQALEKELALRNEENRELLKLKIDMLGRQMAAERAGSAVSTITASS